jgi:hypothetical protein
MWYRWERANLLVEVACLTRHGGNVRGDARLDQPLVQASQLLAILCHVVDDGREVEAVRPVQLTLDETWRHDASTEVDDLVGHGELIVEGRLAADDLARGRTDPDVTPYQVITTDETAVGQLGDAVMAGRS